MSEDHESQTPPKESSLLDFAMSARQRPAAKPALVSDLAEYRATLDWLPGERVRGVAGSLLIPHPTDNEYDSTEEIVSYNQFMSAHRDATPGYLCLNFTIGSFEVFGDNMRALLMRFHPPGVVKELVIFDPKTHKNPAEGEPVIHSVRYVSRAQATKGA